MTRNKDCVFCKIANNEEYSNIIYEDELVCCFLDIDPINEGHILIIPKEHFHDIDDLDDKTLLIFHSKNCIINKNDFME